MSSDQRKKRLNTDVFSYTSREQYRSKKKHLSSSQFGSNWKLNPHASLKWDENEKRALTKGEQIGLSKRDLKPFRTPLTHCSNSLADVITIPKDVFELDDLAEVLSIEVWQSILTEKERSHLTHFLPRGVNPDEVVQDLLAGENLHFGNPFLKWSSMLCSGELHPEAVLSNDQTLGANKNAYYSELQKYHDNMIRNLQKLKDRCANAKDPEAEIEQMMWRTKKPGKEVRCQQRSVTADEKACSSDNQSTLKARGSHFPRRKDTRKDKDVRQVGSSDVVASKPKKREKLQKFSSNYGDGSKYMSYVKISKSQHELVRNMKQSGNSIQSKALNHVIGNLNSFNVKPYVMFEEEEQKRIEEYWSKLANKDIPSAVSKWRKIQSERGEIMKSLCLELEEKCLMEEEETGHSDDARNYEEASVSSDDNEQTEEEEAPLAHESVSDDGQDSDPSSPEGQPPSELPCLDESQFAEEQASLQMRSLGVNQKCSPMDLNEEDNGISRKSNDTCSVKSDGHVTSEASLESRSTSVSPEKQRSLVNEEVPHSSARDAWSGIMVEPSFCPAAMDFASCRGMPLNHSEAIKGQTTQLIDLASSIPDENNPSKSLLPQQTDQLPFFGTYQNDERHDMLHTLVKRDNYHEEPKKTALGFHPTTNLLIDPTQFPGHSRDQLNPSFPLQPRHVHTREHLNPSFPIEPRHRAPNDFYLHPTIPENMYPDSSSRYSVPRPEQFTPVNLREWNNAPRFSTPMQAPLNNSMDLLNHNWFQVENRAQGGWSGSEVFPNPSLVTGSGGGDQSLFSVLSQCNSLHPGAPTFGVPTGNFSGDMGIGVPRNSPLPQHSVAASPLDYLNGHDIGPSTLKTGDMGWMNLSHQSSALHDAAGKPFPKPWNQ